MSTDGGLFDDWFYYLDDVSNGLAIGMHNNAWKLFRVWRREDGVLYHHCIAVFPNYDSADMMMEWLEEKFEAIIKKAVATRH